MNEIDWSKVSKKVPSFSLEGHTCLAKCVKVYDGDTITLAFPWKGEMLKWRCRLEEIDTPELKKKNKTEYFFGVRVRDMVRTLILDEIVHVVCGKFDKYGRLLVWVYLNTPPLNRPGGMSVNFLLVQSRCALPYDGGKKKSWTTVDDWNAFFSEEDVVCCTTRLLKKSLNLQMKLFKQGDSNEKLKVHQKPLEMKRLPPNPPCPEEGQGINLPN
jgi:endonuclease YncB( thermonuclease family)